MVLGYENVCTIEHKQKIGQAAKNYKRGTNGKFKVRDE